MSSNYPNGSMMGSGIYSQEVSHDSFDCMLCGETNEHDEVATDDWGNYEINCSVCGATHKQSSLKEDRDDYHDY
jgi:transcription elongation factor Elf1